MNKAKVGIVGIGNVGSSHAASICAGKIKGMELAAVCDISEAKLDWANDALPGVARYDDYADMLNNAHLDAVIIATPHYYHCPMAVEAFSKGLHVLTEKPAGVFTKQVEEMNQAAADSGKIFCIMYNQRTNPIYRKAKELVESGKLGQLKRSVWIITNWYRTQAYYDSGSWRATWAGEGGGVLLNQAPHNLDLWQWISGMPTAITGYCYYGKYHNIEVEDDVTAFVEYENGATGAFITSTGEYPGTNRLEICGDKGKLVIEHGKLIFTELQQAEREFCFTETASFSQIPHTVNELKPDGIETGHDGILQNFTNAILHGEKLIAPGYEGINGLTISNAIHLSSWTGQRIQLPLDKDLFCKLLQEKAAASSIKQSDDTTSNSQGERSSRWDIKW